MRLKSGYLKNDRRLRIYLNMKDAKLDVAHMVMCIKQREKMGELKQNVHKAIFDVNFSSVLTGETKYV